MASGRTSQVSEAVRVEQCEKCEVNTMNWIMADRLDQSERHYSAGFRFSALVTPVKLLSDYI